MTEACAASHLWVDGALDVFFAKAEARPVKGLRLDDVLTELRGRSWSNHAPGKLEVTLSWTSSAWADWTIAHRQINKPNQPSKPRHMASLLARAVRRHHANLANDLGSPGRLVVFLQTEDYPNLLPMHAGGRADIMAMWALPLFSMCATEEATDVPVPDFTYVQYSESGRTEEWDEMRRKIGAAAMMRTPWRDRRPALVWRGAVRAGGHAQGPVAELSSSSPRPSVPRWQRRTT